MVWPARIYYVISSESTRREPHAQERDSDNDMELYSREAVIGACIDAAPAEEGDLACSVLAPAVNGPRSMAEVTTSSLLRQSAQPLSFHVLGLFIGYQRLSDHGAHE